MLLLHTLAYPLSGLLNTTFSDASVITEGSLEFLDHCGDIRSCRTVEEILYSCLAVMVACTWTSVHQNIPRYFGYPWSPTPVEQGSSFVVPQWMILFQNVSFMLLAFYAPEVIILWAARQWYSAWCIADKYKGYNWTMAHGHFLIMGGFSLFENEDYRFTIKDDDDFSEDDRKIVEKIAKYLDLQATFQESKYGLRLSAPPHIPFLPRSPSDFWNRAPPPSPSSCRYELLPASDPNLIQARCLLEFLIQHKFISITTEEIAAKGKRDVLVKTFAIVQTFWFIAQCVARALEGLVVTKLEVRTLAFALVNIGTYTLWWNKPQGVRYPVKIIYNADHRKPVQRERDQESFGYDWVRCIQEDIEDWLRFNWKLLSGTKDGLKETNKRNNGENERNESILPRPLRVILYPFTTTILTLLLLVTTVIPQIFLKVIPITLIVLKSLYHCICNGAERAKSWGLLRLFLIIFVGIPFVFPFCVAISPFMLVIWLSYQTQLLVKSVSHYQTGRKTYSGWLSASVTLVFILFGGLHCIPWNFGFPTSIEHILWRASAATMTIFPLVHRYIEYSLPDKTSYALFIIPLPYITARVVVIVLVFTGLRALPPTAYETVDWTKLIPHV